MTKGYSGDNLPATAAQLNNPVGITLDTLGNLYITEWENHRVRKVDTAGTISTIAGIGTAGYNGDNIFAVSAQLNGPTGVTFDKQGNMYIADGGNNRIRKVDRTGIITTIAGSGSEGYSGDNGSATIAELKNPYDVKVDHLGNIYFTDFLNNCIRRIDNGGIITTIAGGGTNADIGYEGIAIDNSGTIYITEFGNHNVRKVNTSGIITTIAGTGTEGYDGDGGSAIDAILKKPTGITLDAYGNIYFTDELNHRVRKLTPSNLSTTAQHKTYFKLYPNPANHELTLESDGNMESIEIYDAVGRLMHNIQPSSGVVKIDLSSYTNGTYFITMQIKSGEIFREKIIKQ